MKNINKVKGFLIVSKLTLEFDMDKRSSYVILFNSWRWINLSDIVIHDIDPIRLYLDVIHLIEFTDKRFIISISMGLNPELLRIKEKRKDEIMEVNILAFIATALFILIPTAFLLIIYVKTVSQSD